MLLGQNAFRTVKAVFSWGLVVGPVLSVSVYGWLYLNTLSDQLVELKSNEDKITETLVDLSTEMATQSNSLEDLAHHALQMETDLGGLDKSLTETRVYIADKLGSHEGEHGRFEGAADRFEELLRKLEAGNRVQ